MTDMRNNKSQMAETETNNTKTLKEIFSEEIRAELASGRTKKPTFEQFKEMVEKEKFKRRKKYTAIAACFVAALVVGFFAFDMMADDVGADKNPKEIIQTEDGVIIEDGGWGSSTGEDNVWETNDNKEIDTMKETFPHLLVPKYIPNGYVFKLLSVESLGSKDLFCEYKYSFNKNKTLEIELFITKNDLISIDISDMHRTLNTNQGAVYLYDEEEKATIKFDNGTIVTIFGTLTDSDIIKIINNIN